MFGYVRPYKSEMLVREYDQYKAAYCQLCKELGKSFGIGARFILSYDCTFYAMLAIGVTGSELTLHHGKCKMNPLKKCSYIASYGEEYKRAAALSVITTYHKLRDTIEDDSFRKSFVSRLALPFMKRKYKKASGMYPLMAKAVEEAMADQQEAEKDPQASIDRCCEPTAHMLSVLFEELGGCNERQKPVLRQIGYFLGRWIYAMDAADDLRDDLETGSFNPFIHKLSLQNYLPDKGQKRSKQLLSGENRKNVELACNEVLNTNIAMILPALNLLELQNFDAIIENIIKKGLPEMQREILFLHVKEKGNDRSV